MCLPLGPHVHKAKGGTYRNKCPASLALPNYLLTFYVALVDYHVLRLCPVLNILPAPLISCASPVTRRATRASSRFFKHIILPESLGPCSFHHLEHSPLPLSFKNTFSERPSLTTPYKAGLSHACSQRRAHFLVDTYQTLKLQTYLFGDLLICVSPTKL